LPPLALEKAEWRGGDDSPDFADSHGDHRHVKKMSEIPAG
jgi:hypothetical protein